LNFEILFQVYLLFSYSSDHLMVRTDTLSGRKVYLLFRSPYGQDGPILRTERLPTLQITLWSGRTHSQDGTSTYSSDHLLVRTDTFSGRNIYLLFRSPYGQDGRILRTDLPTLQITFWSGRTHSQDGTSTYSSDHLLVRTDTFSGRNVYLLFRSPYDQDGHILRTEHLPTLQITLWSGGFYPERWFGVVVLIGHLGLERWFYLGRPLDEGGFT
jgi:hypothetical protein